MQGVGSTSNIINAARSSESRFETTLARGTVISVGSSNLVPTSATLSENRQILYVGPKEVYASREMINRANSIPNGQVRMDPIAGRQSVSVNDVELIPIAPKATGELQARTHAYATDGGVTGLEREIGRLNEMSLEQNFKDAAVKDVIKAHLDDLREDYDSDDSISSAEYREGRVGEEYPEEIEEKIQTLANEEPELLARQNSYNESVRFDANNNPDRIFPTDCGVMADAVSGQNSANRTAATGPVRSGDAFHINVASDEGAERKNLWGSHHAGVIMADGSDYLTLEGAKQKDGDQVLKANFDTSWYFGLYTTNVQPTGAGLQSFAARYEDSFAPGFNVTHTRQNTVS